MYGILCLRHVTGCSSYVRTGINAGDGRTARHAQAYRFIFEHGPEFRDDGEAEFAWRPTCANASIQGRRSGVPSMLGWRDQSFLPGG
jgi:hypothetical protein